ncbi:MAG TPA: acetyl-CoA C-acetyltransferase [Chromatiales bacterium]|nr:acetyl-CoA C-acetyltransferase [Chromatiaceae bacterium]HIB84350.1 acetyl-CoA C-acetyltransferase [Chromatiaceae bacterium]HIN81389.1 acetyl-CoA C-acetyltransferase [Chromatiales bacterium]HIO13816.1 acetyl-CoA C-acetyltransferase [Chromatiales bacterium]HIO54130.1 acetyl-CoA C-acetyltransferase [Chromatiales bacterium]
MSDTKHGFGRDVFVVDGSRTPFLKATGKRGPFSASDLAVAAGRPLLARQPFLPNALDEVILGCVSPGPDEANVARITALRLGCGESVPAWTVQRNCASGMQSIDSAARNIGSGYANLILAGGAEAMSHSPVLFSDRMVDWLAGFNAARSFSARMKQLSKLKLGYLKPVIGLLRGLRDPIVGLSMGQTAENLAFRFGIDRQQMDQFAVESHQKLVAAQEQGLLQEIEPMCDANGSAYDSDTGVRADSSVERLAKLRPVFDRRIGMVTAGNSAQVTDGAAWLLLASQEAVNQYNLPVLGRIVDSEWSGLDPAEMGLGPAHSMAPILKRHNYKPEDIDYWEINEAFAAQVLACVEAWKSDDYCRQHLDLDGAMGDIDTAHLNIDGGGISLGHPVGASGARIVLHLLHTLARNGGTRGMASLCIGGGQGGAILVESAA